MVANVARALAAGVADGVIGAAHQLKGAASNIGVTKLFKTADLIEVVGRRGGLVALQTEPSAQAAKQNFPAIFDTGMLAVLAYAKAVQERVAALNLANQKHNGEPSG